MHKLGRNSSLWKGYEQISGSFMYLLKDGAKRRNHKFDLTAEQLWNLYIKQNKRCALSGLTLYFAESRYKDRQKQTASLDRIDSSKGYTIDNVQWVHKIINMMKQDYSNEYFIKMCTKVNEWIKSL